MSEYTECMRVKELKGKENAAEVQRDMWDMLLAATNRGALRRSVLDSILPARIDGCNNYVHKTEDIQTIVQGRIQWSPESFGEREENHHSLLLFFWIVDFVAHIRSTDRKSTT